MRKLRQININNVMFLDIETAPNWETLEQAPENVRNEWIYKFKFRAEAPQPLKPETLENANTTPEIIARREKEIEKYFADIWKKEAGLYPEFSRIVCISFGMLTGETFRLKSLADIHEIVLLRQLVDVLNHVYDQNRGLMLCAHNGKEFDYPFIIKRLLFHRLEIPLVLDIYGLKPWEMVTLLDTLEIWKFGSRQGGGLPAIAMHFGIATPKDDIDGSDVSRLFHGGELPRIAVYCEKDVITLVNVFKGMRGEALLDLGQVQKVM